MAKLVKGALRTVVNNENDVKSYLQAGWSIVEEPIEEKKSVGKKVKDVEESKATSKSK